MDALMASCAVETARRCLGVPFHHQGRCAVAGLDCIGLVIVALRSVGVAIVDRVDYGLQPDGDALVEGLVAHGFVRVTDDICAGDVLLFRYGGRPQHVALAVGDGRMIHSFAPARCVVEVALSDYWVRRLVGVFRLDKL